MTTETTKRYRVHVREVWIQTFEVDAESKEDALDMVLNCQGTDTGDLEYGYTPDGSPVQTTLDHVEEV